MKATENYLDKLCEDKLIVSYDDNCKDNIEYVIKFTRENLAKLDDEKLVRNFRKLNSTKQKISPQ